MSRKSAQKYKKLFLVTFVAVIVYVVLKYLLPLVLPFVLAYFICRLFYPWALRLWEKDAYSPGDLFSAVRWAFFTGSCGCDRSGRLVSADPAWPDFRQLFSAWSMDEPHLGSDLYFFINDGRGMRTGLSTRHCAPGENLSLPKLRKKYRSFWQALPQISFGEQESFL